MKSKIRLNLPVLYLCFILIPFLKPYNITLIPWLDIIFKIWKIISTSVIIGEFLLKRKKISVGTLYLLLFNLVWVISLLANYDATVFNDYINSILSIIAISLFFESKKDESKYVEYISSFLYLLSSIYIILTLISAIMGGPFGAVEGQLGMIANFLGGDNYSAFILIILCGFLFYYEDAYKEKTRLRTWVIAICGFLSLAIPFSLAGMLSYLFLLVLFMLRRVKFVVNLFNKRNVLIGGGIITFAIGFLNFSDVFSGLLQSIDKVGFNGRNYIWSNAVSSILNKPFLGHGAVGAKTAENWDLLAFANHTHNVILEYPFSVGLIGTAFFVLYLIEVFKCTKFQLYSATLPLMLTFSAFLLCSIFDFYIGLIYFYLLLEIIRNSKDVNIKKETKIEQ